ncbi:hypothetical protein V5P93_002401 [Actinokineospora auranticolor]|uniref:Uncharacterized protein n=1 Tax=Actinokineospora auranticolor TaxID=155976 RepID=A0A2S6GBX7_9PSEU|nr:hypothetical protein [Actinokineospora auranticolor]PPK61863.1 hypothetical protein CLV40_13811 [Actinokineospora auranticolor]
MAERRTAGQAVDQGMRGRVDSIRRDGTWIDAYDLPEPADTPLIEVVELDG